MDWNGKAVLVTGGASGMGRTMALLLAQAGAKVAIVDLNAQALATTAAEHPNLQPHACNVGDPEAIAEVVSRVERDLGPIYRLACCAGIMPAHSVIDMPVDGFARVMRVNYEGTVNTVKAVLPGLLARADGQIILFGSLAGVVPAKGFSAYGASKAAINAFGEVLAQELKDKGIRVLSVRPAAVKTPLIQQATGEGGLAGLRKQDQSGRMASPERIIAAIEKTLASGRKDVLYPTGEALFAQWLRRLSPGLTWKIANAVNR